RAEARRRAAGIQGRETGRPEAGVRVDPARGICAGLPGDSRSLAADPGPLGTHPPADTSLSLAAPGADEAAPAPVGAAASVVGPGSSPLPKSDLPQPLTPLLGREREVAEIESWLATARLVTLTGAGGVGKTRLAIQVARELVGDTLEAGPAFASAAFVDLAPLVDPDRVPQAVAATLGVLERPGLPLADTLVAALRLRQLLLVLDNCEHLVGACAALSEALLAGCPELRILATSQEALGLTGEVAWRVPSLSLPDLHELPSFETLTQYAGIRLFIERARAV